VDRRHGDRDIFVADIRRNAEDRESERRVVHLPSTDLRPVSSPDGTKMALSGLRWSGDPEDPVDWYIYVCNLDGSDLRRVAPLEDESAPPYVFPESGKTAELGPPRGCRHRRPSRRSAHVRSATSEPATRPDRSGRSI